MQLMRSCRPGSLWLVPVLILALSFAAFAQEGDQGPSVEQIQEAARQAAEQARQAIEALPDPSQIFTQIDPEQLNQGTPTREYQFVYSLSPWTGVQFGGTFAPKGVDTMFLMADVTSIMNAQRTDVYYWPITGEYMANWFEKRDEVPGKLQIEQNGKVIATLERVDYSYYYPTGYGGQQTLLLGEEAIRTYEDYQNRINSYYDSVSKYYDAQRVWQSTMDKILAEVRETGVPKKPDEIPEPPRQPQAPRDFAYQPRQAFAVNLPAGRYTVKVIDDEGNVVEGSERTLQVYDARRTGVGFGVIPEHKWTRRFQSNDPSDTFYLDGTRVFYILPFSAKEFNYYQYNKMTNLHKPLEAEGTRSAWTWVHFDAITKAKLQVLKDGQVIQEINYEPFYVKQTPGYALGYEIVKFDPENDPTLQGRAPTFEGYRVVLAGDGSSYELRFVDENGNVLEGSTRSVRSVQRPGNSLYAVTVVPLVVGVVVFGWRRSKARKGSASENA